MIIKKEHLMDWWHFFVVAGALGCIVPIFNFFLPMNLARTFQDVEFFGWLVMLGRIGLGLVIQFLLYGLVLGSVLWFLYWLIFD